MDRSKKKYAIEAAKEITVAVMSEGNLRVDKAGGESVGDFFQAVYSKIEEIAKRCSRSWQSVTRQRPL